jgi:antitoxin CcdA
MRIFLCTCEPTMLPRDPSSKITKRAINLSLSSEVLEAAKKLNINVSKVCDAHLKEYVLKEQERRWREDHADFVAVYNKTLESEGLPLDSWRSF